MTKFLFSPIYDWENSDSHLLVNPRYSQSDQECFQEILKESEHLPGHIWLSTSGSSAKKWVGLSKKALLLSAGSVNAHLESDKTDCWINPLPDFHVGGLGVWARAQLSRAKVADFKLNHDKWSAPFFYDFLDHMKGTLTSLVPTQLSDLVALGRKAPSSLRAVIVGGGALSSHLYESAIALQWPILPSYGLTECASQVATAPLFSWKNNQIPPLIMLPHFKGKTNEGRLSFFGDSLLTTYAIFDSKKKCRLIDPKENGWFLSEDRGHIDHENVICYGRADTIVKVGGENVDLAHLEMQLQNLMSQLKLPFEAALVATEDDRLGCCIDLVSTAKEISSLHHLVERFQKNVLPFERIRRVLLLPILPRSPLGKLMQNEIKKSIGMGDFTHQWRCCESPLSR